MISLVGGGALVAGSVLYLALKLEEAYDLGARTQGVRSWPPLGGVILPPLLSTYGVWLGARPVEGVALTSLGAAMIWLGLTAAAGLALSVTFALGARKRRRL